MNRRPCDCTLPRLVAFVLGIGLAGAAFAEPVVIEAPPSLSPWLGVAIFAALIGLVLIAIAVRWPMPQDDDTDEYGAQDTRDPRQEDR